MALNLSVRSDCMGKRYNAPRTRPRTRVCKNQKISLHFSRASPPTTPPRSGKEMERNFLVLLRRISLRKEQSYFNVFVCSFLHFHGDRGAASPRLVIFKISCFGHWDQYIQDTPCLCSILLDIFPQTDPLFAWSLLLIDYYQLFD